MPDNSRRSPTGVNYEIDPASTFPRHYTGEVIVTLAAAAHSAIAKQSTAATASVR